MGEREEAAIDQAALKATQLCQPRCRRLLLCRGWGPRGAGTQGQPSASAAPARPPGGLLWGGFSPPVTRCCPRVRSARLGGLGGGHPLGDPSCACLSPWRNLHTSEGVSGPFPSLAVGFGGCVPKQCQHHKDLIPSECFASCADQDPSASPAAAHQRLLARSRPPNQAGAGSVPRVPSVTASVPWDRWQGAARGREGKKIPADVRASPSWWTAKNQHCGLGFLTPLRASRAFAKA